VVEHVTFNHGVEGSSPSALTIKINTFAQNRRFPANPLCGRCVGKSIAALAARPDGCDQISTPAENQLRFTVPSADTVFLRFFWCRRIGMMPTEHLFRKGAATMRDSQPMIASKLELSPCAVSVLGQLFVEGPTSDDNIASKAGRCDLVSAGLAFHEAGLSSLTPDGVRLAREWDLCSLYARRDRRWYLKVRTNPRFEGAAVSHSESGAAVR
jgi:hypothetical protein